MVRARSSNLLRRITILLIICSCSLAWANGKYGGGSGTPQDPYQIWDANHMQAIGADANDWDKHFILIADVNLSGYTGDEFNLIGNYPSNAFTGVFDGNDHTISHLTYISTEARKIGLFRYINGSYAEIRNLGLTEPNVDAGTGWEAGALFGYLRDGIVSHCYVEGGQVSGRSFVGGLGGDNNAGTVSNCYSTARIYGEDQAGGLIGVMSPSGTISHCYASGDVSAGGVREEVSAVGGLVAYLHGTIADSYASGDVSGIDRPAGGLVGVASGGSISNCYASGHVSDTSGNAGGLIGRDFGFVSYAKCFWDNMVNPLLQGFGDGAGDPNVIEKSTIEMQTASTFTEPGWDFINVWNIGEKQTYPYLRTVPAGDINKDRIVNFLDLCIVADQWMTEPD